MLHNKTIEHNGAVVIVSRAVKGTPMIAAIYASALMDLYPEARAVELPKLPNYRAEVKGLKNGAKEHNAEEVATYNEAVREIITRNALGWNRLNSILEFTRYAARTTTVNAPFTLLPKDQKPNIEVLNTAYESFLFDDPEGLWPLILDSADEMDEPVTPPEQQPPETLSEDEQNDPNSEAVAVPGSEK